MYSYSNFLWREVVIVQYLVISPKWTDIVTDWGLIFGSTKVIQLFLYLVTDLIITLLIVLVFQKDTVYPLPTLLKVMNTCFFCRRSNT